MKLTTTLVAVGLTLAALHASSAMAQNARSFVSPTGSDSAACTLLAPCRNFQPAYAKTNPGGEIAVLGTAGYGPLVIDHAISIVNAGGYEAGIFVPAGGAGITVNAGTNDAVILRGLTINGGGTGHNGIVFNTGASLTVDHCVVQNMLSVVGDSYTGIGIVIAPTAGTISFAITDTAVTNNGRHGFAFYPPSGSANANGAIDHLVATGNAIGLYIDASAASGGTVNIAVSNSVVSNNQPLGIFAYGSSALSVSVDNVAIGTNATGIEALSSANVSLGRSTIVSNSVRGIINHTNTFFTYQNNQVNLNGNGNAVDGNALTPVSFQ